MDSGTVSDCDKIYCSEGETESIIAALANSSELNLKQKVLLVSRRSDKRGIYAIHTH